MREKILDIVAQIAQRDAVDLEKNLASQGLWDSFARVELVLALEEAFHISFTPEEIAEMTTPEKVIAHVTQKAARE